MKKFVTLINKGKTAKNEWESDDWLSSNFIQCTYIKKIGNSSNCPPYNFLDSLYDKAITTDMMKLTYTNKKNQNFHSFQKIQFVSLHRPQDIISPSF